MLVAQVVLSPEDGALFVKAVDAARAGLDDTGPAPEPGVPDPAAEARPTAETAPDAAADGRAAGGADSDADAGGEEDAGGGEEDAAVTRERTRDADALVAVAAGFLASGAPALSDPTRHTVTVHVHADALAAAYAGVARTGGPADAGGDAEDHARPAGDDGLNADGLNAGDGERDGPERTAEERTEAGDGPAGHADLADDAGRTRAGGASPEHDRPAAARPECAGPQTFPAGPLTGLRCDVEPGVGLHPETVRRIACDAWLRALVVDRNGNPLDLGRRRRLATGRVRDAVYARDRGACRYPGCGRTRWLDVHHLDHWADHHGRTEPPNLVVVCGFHHRAVHEGGTVLRMDPYGAVTAHLPDGRVLHPAPAQHAGDGPLARLARATAGIDAGLPAGGLGWAGGPPHPAGAAHAVLGRRRPRPAPARRGTVA
jgi:hypothetical protein